MYRFNGAPILARPPSPTFYERIRREAFAKAKRLETNPVNDDTSAPAPTAEASSASSPKTQFSKNECCYICSHAFKVTALRDAYIDRLMGEMVMIEIADITASDNASDNASDTAVDTANDNAREKEASV